MGFQIIRDPGNFLGVPTWHWGKRPLGSHEQWQLGLHTAIAASPAKLAASPQHSSGIWIEWEVSVIRQPNWEDSMVVELVSKRWDR